MAGMFLLEKHPKVNNFLEVYQAADFSVCSVCVREALPSKAVIYQVFFHNLPSGF